MSENTIIKDIGKTLFDCLDFEHIEDDEYIKKQLKEIRKSFRDLPIETTTIIENFIKMYVYPILFNTDYFNFTRKDEFGKINEQGIFEINSEASLDKILFLMYQHSFYLQNCLREYFKSYFCVTIK